METYESVDELLAAYHEKYPHPEIQLEPSEVPYHGKRVKRLVFADAAELIFDAIRDINVNQGFKVEVTKDGIPESAKLIGSIYSDETKYLTLFIEDKSFEVFNDLSGRLPPAMTPATRKTEFTSTKEMGDYPNQPY